MEVTLYGSSDDLIQIEGGIEEEFDYLRWADEGHGALIGFSDGTLLRVKLDHHDEVWRITPVFVPDQSRLTIVQAPASDEHNYSDRATLVGEIQWALMGSHLAKS